jgi:hypothetical protein
MILQTICRMSDIDLTYNTVLPVVGVVIGLGLILWTTVIPQYVSPQYPQNKSILYAILAMNFLFSIILLLLLYVYNSNLKDNIIHLSLMFTFLVALPATLYNVGVSSLVFSNT